MDTRWLRVLVELADRGTLRAVAAATGFSTSAVSQQLAALQRELGQELAQPSGRGLSLTPAGRALLPRARVVLAELDAARGELAPEGPPVGTVRLAGYETAVRRQVFPAVLQLRERYPDLTVTLEDREPGEVVPMLEADLVDVGLVYEYDLVPRGYAGRAFDRTDMMLVVRDGETRSPDEIFADPETGWITNSRATDDDDLIRHVTGGFGVTPRIVHRLDSLDLVLDLVLADLGTALVAATGPRHPGVTYLDCHGRAGSRLGHAITRPGREHWRANAVVIEAITTDRTAEQVADRFSAENP